MTEVHQDAPSHPPDKTTEAVWDVLVSGKTSAK